MENSSATPTHIAKSAGDGTSEPPSEKSKEASIEGQSSTASSPETLPILPVRGIVLFPNMVVPLTIGRPAALTLVESQLPENKHLGIVTQIDEEKDQPRPEDLYNIGVSAQVVKLLRQPDGIVVLIVQVLSRVEILSYTQFDPFLRATVRPLETIAPPENDPILLASFNNLQTSAMKLLQLSPEIPDQARATFANVEDPEKFADLLAGNLGIQVGVKQQILAERDLIKRLQLVQEALQRQLEIAELQQKLRKDVEGK